MAYAREDPKVSTPEGTKGGLEVSLPRRIKEDEYVNSWFGASIGDDIFAWIESGLEDDTDGSFVRTTLYTSSTFWTLHGIELALGNKVYWRSP